MCNQMLRICFFDLRLSLDDDCFISSFTHANNEEIVKPVLLIGQCNLGLIAPVAGLVSMKLGFTSLTMPFLSISRVAIISGM